MVSKVKISSRWFQENETLSEGGFMSPRGVLAIYLPWGWFQDACLSDCCPVLPDVHCLAASNVRGLALLDYD